MRTLRQAGAFRGSPSARRANTTVRRRAFFDLDLGQPRFAVSRDLQGKKNNVIAVIGDGAMSAGMAYEAMNNAGARKERLIVVLNDNDMSIAPPVGAMSAYLARLISSKEYLSFRAFAKSVAHKILPKTLEQRAKRAEEYARAWLSAAPCSMNWLLLCRSHRRA